MRFLAELLEEVGRACNDVDDDGDDWPRSSSLMSRPYNAPASPLRVSGFLFGTDQTPDVRSNGDGRSSPSFDTAGDFYNANSNTADTPHFDAPPTSILGSTVQLNGQQQRSASDLFCSCGVCPFSRLHDGIDYPSTPSTTREGNVTALKALESGVENSVFNVARFSFFNIDVRMIMIFVLNLIFESYSAPPAPNRM